MTNLGALSEYAKWSQSSTKIKKMLKSLSYILDTMIWSKKTSHATVPLNDKHAFVEIMHLPFTKAHPQGREAWGGGAGSGTWIWRGPPPACPCSSPGSPPRCTSPSRQNVWSCKKSIVRIVLQLRDPVLFLPLEPGSGMGKIRTEIRDEYPGSYFLIIDFLKFDPLTAIGMALSVNLGPKCQNLFPLVSDYAESSLA